MMNMLPPWSYSTFDLIVHAEMHYLNGKDFDRRIAFINFDNSIEVSITTYLNLKPNQSKGRKIKKEERNKWLTNYHTKIDFFESWIKENNLTFDIKKENIFWYHEIRNNQYHDCLKGIPEVRDLEEIRKIALLVFSKLFDVPDIEQKLKEQIDEISPKKLKYEKDSKINKNIDQKYGTVEVAGYTYNTSELLFGVDPIAYQEIVLSLNEVDLSLKNKKIKI